MTTNTGAILKTYLRRHGHSLEAVYNTEPHGHN